MVGKNKSTYQGEGKKKFWIWSKTNENSENDLDKMLEELLKDRTFITSQDLQEAYAANGFTKKYMSTLCTKMENLGWVHSRKDNQRGFRKIGDDFEERIEKLVEKLDKTKFISSAIILKQCEKEGFTTHEYKYKITPLLIKNNWVKTKEMHIVGWKQYTEE